MLKDFMQALARVQSDFSFYIGCQVNPDVALSAYALDASEHEALTDPEKLAAVLSETPGVFLPRLTITISGKHDWVNRTLLADTSSDGVERSRSIESEVGAISAAGSREERKQAAIRLMGLIG